MKSKQCNSMQEANIDNENTALQDEKAQLHTEPKQLVNDTTIHK